MCSNNISIKRKYRTTAKIFDLIFVARCVGNMEKKWEFSFAITARAREKFMLE
jgi:hypothetical protein